MILATPNSITGFLTLMEEAGLTYPVGQDTSDSDQVVSTFWGMVEDQVDSVSASRNSLGAREYTIVDGAVTSVNNDKIDALIGWALAVKGTPSAVSDTVVTPHRDANELTVQDYVDNFTAGARSFTAHDITQAIRRDVNNDTGVDWDDRPTTSPQGNTVPFVDHDEIRRFVHAYMNVHQDYTIQDNGTYQTYRPL